LHWQAGLVTAAAGGAILKVERRPSSGGVHWIACS